MGVFIFIIAVIAFICFQFIRPVRFRSDAVKRLSVPVELPENFRDPLNLMDLLQEKLKFSNLKSLSFGEPKMLQRQDSISPDTYSVILARCKYGTYGFYITDDKLVTEIQKEKFGGRLAAESRWFEAQAACEAEYLRACIVKLYYPNSPENPLKMEANLKRNWWLFWIWWIVIGIAIVCVIISNLPGLGDQSLGVRDSYLRQYSTEYTVGDAMNAYFYGSPDMKWSNYSTNNATYVECSGTRTMDDGSTSYAQVIFEIDGDMFRVHDIISDGISMGILGEFGGIVNAAALENAYARAAELDRASFSASSADIPNSNNTYIGAATSDGEEGHSYGNGTTAGDDLTFDRYLGTDLRVYFSADNTLDPVESENLWWYIGYDFDNGTLYDDCISHEIDPRPYTYSLGSANGDVYDLGIDGEYGSEDYYGAIQQLDNLEARGMIELPNLNH